MVVKFILKVILLFFIFRRYSFGKCQKEFIQAHYLSGMDESAPIQMQICKYVKNRCCTVSDEIRILKFFKEYSVPLMSAHTDKYFETVSKIMNILDKMKTLDPMAMNIRFRVRKDVPYHQEICTREIKYESKNDHKDFIKFYDKSLFANFNKYNYRPPNNDEKETLLLKEKDNGGFRHWGTKNDRKEVAVIKMHWDKIDKLEEGVVEYQQIQCEQKKSKFYKDFIIINEVKTEFCFQIYKKMLDFNNQKMKEYLPYMRRNIYNIQQLRMGYYCALCNGDEQKYFNLDTQRIDMSHQFCFNMIQSNSMIINFLNIVLIEYLEFMFEIKACFAGPAKGYKKEEMLQKFRRRIPMYKSCLKTVKDKDEITPDFIKNCWFICQGFKLNNVSPIFEGDLELMNQVLIDMLSFQRQTMELDEFEEDMKKYEGARIGTEKGELLEPVSAVYTISNKYYFPTKLRKELIGTADTLRKIDPLILKRLKKSFEKKNLKKAIALLQEYEKEYKAQKESKLYKKKLIYSIGQEIYKKKMATGNYQKPKKQITKITSSMSPPRKLLQNKFERNLLLAHSKCKNHKGKFGKFHLCLNRQLKSKDNIIQPCKKKHNSILKQQNCERKLKGSLEFQCFDEMQQNKQILKNCLNQKSLNSEYKCRNEKSDFGYNFCQQEYEKTSQFECQNQSGNKNTYDFCIQDSNSRKLKEIENSYEQKCMTHLQDQDEYANCMQELEKNDFFICKQFINKNQKFSNCMQKLSNNRKEQQFRKLEQENPQKAEEIKKAVEEEDDDTKRVEEGTVIYGISKKLMDIQDFTQIIKTEGLNPFEQFDNFDSFLQVDELISKHFRQLEDIDTETIQTYLKSENTVINKFNHQVDKMIIDSDNILPATREYNDTHSKYQKEKVALKRIVLKQQLDRLQIEYKQWQNDKPKQDLIRDEMVKLQKQLKETKLKEKSEKKVISHHHKDKPHMENSMNDVFDVFTAIFGSQFILKYLLINLFFLKLEILNWLLQYGLIKF